MRYFLLVLLFSGVVMSEPLVATLETNKGRIVISLYADKTPKTVASFGNLIRRGFYDGTTFHRVISNFVIQGGDPTGSGSGGPGYRFEDEIVPSLKHDREGVLSMANAGPGTNGSQFFITLSAQPHLNGKHTVFGNVIEGMEVVNSIKQGDKITKASLSGDWENLASKEKASLESWNAVLDKR